ncbi:MAG: hypothetical protein WA052_02440 [Microgenomates group bacterium]
MQMPVIVGIVVAVIFLVSFSEWFYHLVVGWEDFVLDDVYFRYRIVGVSLLSILVMSGTFYGMALINECPNETREGLFAKLNCEEYSKIVVGTEKILMKVEKPLE